MNDKRIFNPVETNIIIYCNKFRECKVFYENILQLKKIFDRGWFIQYKISNTSGLSIADEKKSSVKSSPGNVVTISCMVSDIEKVYDYLKNYYDVPAPVKVHPWGGNYFFIYDPDGNRIELWSK